MESIQRCSEKLRHWNRFEFGNVQTKLSKTHTRLKHLQELDSLLLDHDQQKEAHREVQNWLEKDKLMWKYRSRVLWLKEGDKKLKHFLQRASSIRS